MPIFSKRTLQRLIDENSRFLTKEQLLKHINGLNKSNEDSINFEWEVHPYSLLFYRGEFYLLCFVSGKGMRHFALEGIKKAERLKEKFDIPEDFSITDFLKVPFGLFHGKPVTVKVIFNKDLSDSKWLPE